MLSYSVVFIEKMNSLQMFLKKLQKTNSTYKPNKQASATHGSCEVSELFSKID